MKTKLKKFALCLLAGIMVLAAAFPALGAETGSLSVTVSDTKDRPISGFTVMLCRVAEEDGVLLGDFAAAGIRPEMLMNVSNNAGNAKKLLRYTENVVPETCVTDDSGNAKFENLSSGVYLVYDPGGQGYIFDPFLLFIPTEVDGKTYYDVESKPKVEEEQPEPPGPGPVDPTPTPTPSEEPVEPTPTPSEEPVDPTPTPSDEPGESTPPPTPSEDEERPVLPLTGVERRPVWALLVLGGAFVIAGVLQLCLRREKHE